MDLMYAMLIEKDSDLTHDWNVKLTTSTSEVDRYHIWKDIYDLMHSTTKNEIEKEKQKVIGGIYDRH